SPTVGQRATPTAPPSPTPPELTATPTTAPTPSPTTPAVRPSTTRPPALPTPSPTVEQPVISGYPDRPSVRPGETLILHISTTAPRFHLAIYRQTTKLELITEHADLQG